MAGTDSVEMAKSPKSSSLKVAWVLMLIVGLVPFSYGVAFLVGYAASAASGNPIALTAVEPLSDIWALKGDFATFFWGSIIIVLSLKGLRGGLKWAWYLLMLIPLYYAGQALIGWPREAAFLVPLALMSAISVVLPFRYFTGSKRRPGA